MYIYIYEYILNIHTYIYIHIYIYIYIINALDIVCYICCAYRLFNWKKRKKSCFFVSGCK